jgi:hypothetical protein
MYQDAPNRQARQLGHCMTGMPPQTGSSSIAAGFAAARDSTREETRVKRQSNIEVIPLPLEPTKSCDHLTTTLEGGCPALI